MRERCLQARTANCQTQTDCRMVLCPCVCVCVLQKENRGVLGWQKSHCRGRIRLCGWIHAVIDPQQWSVCGRGMYEEAREAMSHTKHTHRHTHTHTQIRMRNYCKQVISNMRFKLVIDRYWFLITDTDTDNLYVYVPITDIQNRYLFTVIK